MPKTIKERTRISRDGHPYPYPDFPLTAHPSGRWCKKIKKKIVYFGYWDQWEDALAKYKDQRDDLYLGREPQQTGESVRDLLNAFLSSKQTRVDTGELAACTFADYKATCEQVVECFGRIRPLTSLTRADFEALRGHLAKGKKHKLTGKRRKLGAVALKGELTQARMIFGYAAESGVVLPYKKALSSPSRKNLRKVRNDQGERLFSPEEIRLMLKNADLQLCAMIYLGINCGFGPTDCGRFALNDFRDGWHTMARPKTQTPRRCPLWPETIKAINAYLKVRPTPKPGNERLVFVTKYGNSWARKSGDNALSSEFAKLLDTLKIHRPGNTFYSLRRTFETVASAIGPQAAVDSVMGHTPHSGDMSAVYRQRVYDKNLVKVTQFVRRWLLGKVKLD